MTIFFYISCIVFLAYVLMVVLFLSGWRKVEEFTSTTTSSPSSKLSLVVCCRNEEKNLPLLLDSIASQTYHNFECIFINDHSTDGTLTLLQHFSTHHPYAIVLEAQGRGKKNALREALLHAQGSLVCCTDADCILPPRYLHTMAAYYESHHPDLILGAVKMRYRDTLFEKLQALEFLSLMASGAGSAGVGRPVLANGANIAFTPHAWNEAANHLHTDTPSGDDEFLLHYLKQQRCHIHFLKSRDAIVTTVTSPTLRSFFSQRARWASKSTKYTDADTILVACLVLLSSLLMMAWGVIACCGWRYLNVFVIFFFLKYIMDTILMRETTPFFAEEKLCKHTLLLSLIYPFYVLSSVLLGLVGVWNWKNK